VAVLGKLDSCTLLWAPPFGSPLAWFAQSMCVLRRPRAPFSLRTTAFCVFHLSVSLVRLDFFFIALFCYGLDPPSDVLGNTGGSLLLLPTCFFFVPCTLRFFFLCAFIGNRSSNLARLVQTPLLKKIPVRELVFFLPTLPSLRVQDAYFRLLLLQSQGALPYFVCNDCIRGPFRPIGVFPCRPRFFSVLRPLLFIACISFFSHRFRACLPLSRRVRLIFYA